MEEHQLTPSGPDAASVALPGEIRSAHVAQLTSRDLKGLKRLINKVAGRRRGLSTRLCGDVAARNTAWRALERARKFPLRPFRRGSVPRLQVAFDLRKDVVEERAAEYDACHVQVDFAFGDEALGAYRDLSAANARLARSQRVWDVTSSVAIDRVA